MNVAAALLALGFLVPLHEPPWPGFVGDVCAAVALLLLVLAMPPRRWPWPALAVLALAVVPLIQHAYGLVTYRGDAVMASLYLVGLAFAMQVGAQAEFITSGKASGLAKAVLCAALVSAALALVHAAGWLSEGTWLGPQLRAGRAVANLAQPNLLATLLALGLVVLLAGWPAERLLRVLAWVAAGLLLLTLAMTGSRTGLLQVSLLLGLGLLAPARLGLRVERRALLTMAAVLLTALVLTTVMAQNPLSRGWLHAESVVARWDYLRLFVAALQHSPWVGYGFNQVSNAQSSEMLLSPSPPVWTEHSHNLALDALLWCGLPLGLLVLGGLAAVLWRGLRRLPSDPHVGPVALGALVLLVHAMLEYPLDYFIFLLPFGLLLGRLSSHEGHMEMPSAARWAITAVSAAALLMTVVDYRSIASPVVQARLALVRPMVIDGPPREMLLLDQLAVQYEMARYLSDMAPASASLASMAMATERFAYVPVIEKLAQDAQARGDAVMATRLRKRLAVMRPPRSGG